MAELREFVYMVRPTRIEMLMVGPNAEETKILTDHFDYLKDLTQKKVVILAGRTLTSDESGFGIVIFKANSEDDARRIMENDPAVEHGIMHAELFPYKVALIANP
jgi:uncharacterized protein YciI